MNDDNKELVDEMFRSIKNNKLEIIKEILATHPELINATMYGWKYGNNLLMESVKSKRKEICIYLIECGIDVNLVKNDGSFTTALQYSSGKFREEAGSVEMAKELLSRGAWVDGDSRGITTPLVSSAQNGEIEIVKVFLEYGADINRLHRQFNETALDLAKGWAGDTETIELLESNGALHSQETINLATERASGILEYIYKEVGAILSYKLSHESVDIRLALIEKNKKLKLLFTIGAFPQLPRVEFLVCVPYNWPVNKQIMKDHPNYSFPMQLLFELAKHRLGGEEISEGYIVDRQDEKWNRLVWPENIDSFILVDFEFSKEEKVPNKSEIPYEEKVSLLLLVPHKLPKSGQLKDKKLWEWVEKRRTASWSRNALKEEHFGDID